MFWKGPYATTKALGGVGAIRLALGLLCWPSYCEWLGAVGIALSLSGPCYFVLAIVACRFARFAAISGAVANAIYLVLLAFKVRLEGFESVTVGYLLEVPILFLLGVALLSALTRSSPGKPHPDTAPLEPKSQPTTCGSAS